MRRAAHRHRTSDRSQHRSTMLLCTCISSKESGQVQVPRAEVKWRGSRGRWLSACRGERADTRRTTHRRPYNIPYHRRCYRSAPRGLPRGHCSPFTTSPEGDNCTDSMLCRPYWAGMVDIGCTPHVGLVSYTCKGEQYDAGYYMQCQSFRGELYGHVSRGRTGRHEHEELSLPIT